MIRGTDSTDRPVERPPGLRRFVRRKGLWIASLLLLAMAFVAYPSVSRWARSERSIEGSRLRLATVTRGDLEREVAVEGRVVAAYHPTAFSPARGIVDLRVRAGEVVEEGQVLAVVESPELRAELEGEVSTLQSMLSELEGRRLRAEQAELEDAQAVDLLVVRVEAAERGMARAQRIYDEGVVNVIEYEEAQDELKLARLELDHARRKAELERRRRAFEIEDAELRVKRQRLRVGELERRVGELAVAAPVAGLVSRLDAGDRDAVVTGQPLVTVVDLTALELEIDVPEGYADEVAVGTPAVVRSEEREYAGEVVRMAPEVASGLVRGRVAFTGEAPRGLKQSQRLGTRLVLESRADVLKLERGAFVESGGGRVAYVVEGGLARRRAIELGAASVAEVEVRSGLQEGEVVIVSDLARFEDAETVLIR